MTSTYQAEAYSYAAQPATYSYDQTQPAQYAATDQYSSYSYTTTPAPSSTSYTGAYDASAYSATATATAAAQYASTQYGQSSYSATTATPDSYTMSTDQYTSSAPADTQYSTSTQYSATTPTYDATTGQYSTTAGQYSSSYTTPYDPASYGTSSTPVQYSTTDSTTAAVTTQYTPSQYGTSTERYQSPESYQSSNQYSQYSTTGDRYSSGVDYTQNSSYTPGQSYVSSSYGYSSSTYGKSSSSTGVYGSSSYNSGSKYSSGRGSFSSPGRSGFSTGDTRSPSGGFVDKSRSFTSTGSSYGNSQRGSYNTANYGRSDSYNSGRGGSGSYSSPGRGSGRFQNDQKVGADGYSSWKRPQDIYSPNKSDNKVAVAQGKGTLTTGQKSITGADGKSEATGKVGDKPKGRPVFGSGDREPFARGSRGKTFSGAGAKSAGAKAVNVKEEDKKKNGTESKDGKTEDKTANGSGAKATSTEATKKDGETDAIKAEVEIVMKPGMTKEQFEREKEIQRKIRESVVTLVKSEPSENEVRDMLEVAAAPPSLTIPDHLRETLKSLMTDKHCILCALRLTAPLQATQHYHGKNHIKRVRLFVASDGKSGPEKPGAKGAATGDDEKCEDGEKVKKEADVADGKEPEKEFITVNKYEYCQLCAVSFTSLKQAEQHYNGKNHAKRMRLKAATKCLEEAAEQNIVKKGDNNIFECALCQVALTSEEMLNAHINGYKHQAKLQGKDEPLKPERSERGGRFPRGGRGGSRGRGRGRGYRGGPRGGYGYGDHGGFADRGGFGFKRRQYDDFGEPSQFKRPKQE